MVRLELEDEEAKALLSLIMDSANRIIAAGDPGGWLEHIESAEEKIIGAMDEAAIELSRAPCASPAEQ